MPADLTRTGRLIVLMASLLALGCQEGISEEPSMRSAVPPASAAQPHGAGERLALAAAEDWPWWRGPLRNGLAPGTAAPPQSWSASENVVWRAAVPGRGHSSPIVVGDSVYLATANENDEVQSAVAFDRRTGELRWTKEISRGGFPKRIHAKNTHATATIASDGERLFLVFFHHNSLQATALDTKGNQLWQKRVGDFQPQQYQYGYGASPIIYQRAVIVTGEYDGDAFIAALDRVTGEQKWRIERLRNVSYSTPAIGFIAGREQMLISGADRVTSYDPQSGAELWSAPGVTAATCGTMVWDGDMVFASGGYPGSETLAVRADGSGEVLWRNRVKCYEQSMLAHEGHLYALADSGVLYCWNGETGEEMWKQRLQGPISASPVFAGGHIYWANERGTLYVFKPNSKQFNLVAENQLGDESFASPAVSGGQLFLRVADASEGKRQEWLYCLGDDASGAR